METYQMEDLTFTPRRQQHLQKIIEGKNTPHISTELGITPGTSYVHRRDLKNQSRDRFGKRRLAPLIIEAVQTGAISVDHLEQSLLQLTELEGKILASLVEGNTNAEIAAQLGIAIPTVGKHLSQLMKKAGVHNRNMFIAMHAAGKL
jgi:DNA-binding CsgD family transcriptional regulator